MSSKARDCVTLIFASVHVVLPSKIETHRDLRLTVSMITSIQDYNLKNNYERGEVEVRSVNIPQGVGN